MMTIPKIPTDPISAVIWGINLAITGLTEITEAKAAYERLSSGIAARAEAEGREVSAEEQAALDVLLAASERAAAGDNGGFTTL